MRPRTLPGYRAKRAPLRLPSKLAYTALGVAVAGTLACAGESQPPTRADAAVPDGATVDGAMMGCGNSCTAYCLAGSPMIDAAICPGPVATLSDCPIDAGCIAEPFA